MEDWAPKRKIGTALGVQSWARRGWRPPDGADEEILGELEICAEIAGRLNSGRGKGSEHGAGQGLRFG